MQNKTLLSTARTSRQQTSTSTAPLSDKELRVWDLLRSGHELGHGEPPESWAKKKIHQKLQSDLIITETVSNLAGTCKQQQPLQSRYK